MVAQVKVQDADGSIGKVSVRALPLYESRGFKAVDPDEVKAARKAEGITPEDVKASKERLGEAFGGTAAGSAEKTSSKAGASGSGNG